MLIIQEYKFCFFKNRSIFGTLKKQNKHMKSIKLFSVLALSLTIGSASAQIFINTGNPNMDKYKSENPNAVIWDSTKATVKTPAVKTPVVKSPTVKATTPAATVSTPSVKVTTPSVTSTSPVVKAPTVKKVVAPTPPKVKVETEAIAPTPAYNGTINEANNNLPSNAEAGKCYARCFISDQFEFRDEQVIDRPVSYKSQTIPAQYKTVFDTITVRAASIKYQEVPAVYENITEDIMVSPATQKWVKSTADATCLSANPADCQVMCLVEVPAVYKKVSKRVVKSPAYKNEIPVPAEFKIVSRQVVDVPAQQVQIEIPATYKKVVHKELVKKGGYSDWREILCSQNLTTARIVAIQKALKAAGYDAGPFDNVFGAQTKAALVKYQQDKGLPVGNLNMETLKALGVE